MSSTRPVNTSTFKPENDINPFWDKVVATFAETDSEEKAIPADLIDRLGPSIEFSWPKKLPCHSLEYLVQDSPHEIPASSDLASLKYSKIKKLVYQEPQPSFPSCLCLGETIALQELEHRTGINLADDQMQDQMRKFILYVRNGLHEDASVYFANSLSAAKDLRLISRVLHSLTGIRHFRICRLVSVLSLIIGILGFLVVLLLVPERRFWFISNWHWLWCILLYVALSLLSWGVLRLSSTSIQNESNRLRKEFDRREKDRAIYNRLLFNGIDALCADSLKRLLGLNNMLKLPSEAPLLVETKTRYLYETPKCKEVVNLLFEHDTIAIGIVGHRGVGKSSMLEFIRDSVVSAQHKTVFLPVPAVYSEESFLRMLALNISGQLCGMENEPYFVDDRERTNKGPALPRAFIWVYLVGMSLSLVLAMIGLLDYKMNLMMNLSLLVREYLNMPLKMSFIFLLITSITLMYISHGESERRKFNKKYNGVSKNAYSLYRDLRYSWETTDETELHLNSSALETKIARSNKRQGRELTYVDVADRLRRLLEENSRNTESTQAVTILIDELDKLQVDQRTSLITVLKDLFHIGNVRVVVTVAPDAHLAFTNGPFSGERTVYDTAFDEIIEVPDPTAKDICGILQKRVPEFPDGLALYCHCVAIGNPRDAIRVARRVLQERKQAKTDFHLEDTLRSIITTIWQINESEQLKADIAERVVQIALRQVTSDDEWQSEAKPSDFEEADKLTAAVKAASV